MTVRRWDGSSWVEVSGVRNPSRDTLVRVRRADHWETIWPTDVTHVAVSDGNWSDPGTWEGGNVPGDGAVALVRGNVTVTVAQQVDTRLQTLRVWGTCRFAPDSDTRLRVETIETAEGSRFEIGTESTPVEPGSAAEIEFVDLGPIDEAEDPDRVGKGLLVGGDLEIVGTQKTPWSTLQDAPTAGDSSVTLSSTPRNWEVGDEIVIPGLEAYAGLPLSDNDEERTIRAISGATVTFDSALEHDHVPPASDLDTYVLNLTRNVQFYSENTDIPRRGHFMVMSTETIIKNLETRDMGRVDKSRDVTSPLWGRGEADPDSPPNPRARYSLHFHRTGVTEPPHVVQGCVVRRDPGWGFVNHGSHAEIEDNISYRVFGAGFVAENGTEVGTFEGNFALRSEGSGEQTETRKGWDNGFANRMEDPPHNIDDFGHSGHGFWLQSPLVEVEGNVAAGHRHTPFSFWTRALYEEELAGNNPGPDGTESLDGKHDMFPLIPYEVLTDFEKSVCRRGDEDPPVGDSWHDKDPSMVFGTSLPLRSFRDNVAFGCGGGFDLRGGLQFRHDQSKLNWYTHSSNTIYNVAPLYLSDGSAHLTGNFKSSGNTGLDHRYVGNCVADGYRLIGSGDGWGVRRNHAYLDDFHVKNSTIDNWEVGIEPPDYGGKVNECEIENNVFRRNDKDVEIDGQQGGRNGGPIIMAGNTYSGTTTIHYNEIPEDAAIPERFVRPAGEAHSQVRFEGQTLYHGWCDPDFVFVRSGDTQRLDDVLNHGNASRWERLLGGDDPWSVLPGLTHRELYERYGLVFHGGMRDPDASDSERRSDFGGSGGTYDSTPFLGPANKTQPCDEIWVDAADGMSLSGNYTVVDYGDGVTREEPIRLATNRRVVQLDREHDRDWGTPDGSEGWASYTFEVDPGGTYNVYCRAQQGDDNGGTGSNGQNNRFHVRVDGGSWRRYEPNGLRGWQGDDLVWPSNRDGSDFASFDLSAGRHTIDVAGTGSSMRLDKVLIKEETCAAIPYGDGKPQTP